MEANYACFLRMVFPSIQCSIATRNVRCIATSLQNYKVHIDTGTHTCAGGTRRKLLLNIKHLFMCAVSVCVCTFSFAFIVYLSQCLFFVFTYILIETERERDIWFDQITLSRRFSFQPRFFFHYYYFVLKEKYIKKAFLISAAAVFAFNAAQRQSNVHTHTHTHTTEHTRTYTHGRGKFIGLIRKVVIQIR